MLYWIGIVNLCNTAVIVFCLVHLSGGGWSIFKFSIVLVHFIYFQLYFYCTFSKSYKILPNLQYFVYYCCILIRWWLAVGTYFFLSCPLYFFSYFPLSSYLLRLFLYLVSFLLFPCASVWENTRARVHISASHLNGTCFFEKWNSHFHRIFAYQNLIKLTRSFHKRKKKTMQNIFKIVPYPSDLHVFSNYSIRK